MSEPHRTLTTLPSVVKVLILLLVLVLAAAGLIISQRDDTPSSATAAPAPTVQGSDRPTPTVSASSAVPSKNTASDAAGSTAPKSSPPSSAASGSTPTATTSDGAATQTSPPPVPLATVSVEEKKTASADVREYVQSAAAVLADETQPSADELSALAAGPAQGALLADAAEFEENGWHQEGTPKIASLNVTSYDPDATPPQMTVSACIDSSNVRILTAAGDPVRAGGASRSLNILTLIQSDDGKWLVNQLSFPDDPTC